MTEVKEKKENELKLKDLILEIIIARLGLKEKDPSYKNQVEHIKNIMITSKQDISGLLNKGILDRGPYSFGPYFILRSNYGLSITLKAAACVMLDLFRSNIMFVFNPVDLTILKLKHPRTFHRIFNFICCHEVFHLVKDHVTFDILESEDWLDLLKARRDKKSITDITEVNDKIKKKMEIANFAMDMEINPVVLRLFNEEVDNFFLSGSCFPYAFPEAGPAQSFIVYQAYIRKFVFNDNNTMKVQTDDELKERGEHIKTLKEDVKSLFEGMNKMILNATKPSSKLLMRVFKTIIKFIEDNWMNYGFDIFHGYIKNIFVFAHFRCKENIKLLRQVKPDSTQSSDILDKMMDLSYHRSPIALLNKLIEEGDGDGSGDGGLGMDIIISLGEDGEGEGEDDGDGEGQGQDGKKDGKDKKDGKGKGKGEGKDDPNKPPKPPKPPMNDNERIDKIKKSLENMKDKIKENIREVYGEWRKAVGSGTISDIESYIKDPPPPIVTVNWGRILRGHIERILNRLIMNDMANTRRQTIYKNHERKPVIIGNFEHDTTARVFAILDCSGSMSDHEMAYMLSIIAQVCQKYGMPLNIVQAADEIIDHVDVIRNARDAKKFKLVRRGYGGTDFGGPIHHVCEKYKPEVILYVTDLYGDCGKPPPYTKVYWLAVNNETNPTYGTLIKLKPNS